MLALGGGESGLYEGSLKSWDQSAGDERRQRLTAGGQNAKLRVGTGWNKALEHVSLTYILSQSSVCVCVLYLAFNEAHHRLIASCQAGSQPLEALVRLCLCHVT